ncbi:DinB family protein [mine drainage metagenome]|uniref:DinB family protein n=1 Tax=mine drainage metagenome TaxID=410659 RepID=A0A1J5QKQ8_9ZZZZ
MPIPARIATLQLLATYNRWMNEKVYAAAGTLSDEELARDRGAFFGSILGTLNHLVVGDTLWLQRFARHPRVGGPLAPVLALPAPAALDATVFAHLPELQRRRAELDAWIVDWIPTIGEPDLDGALAYANTKGQPQSRNFGGLLLHVFNHQTHHRGQVTTLLAQAGVDVGVTDLVALVPEQAV